MRQAMARNDGAHGGLLGLAERVLAPTYRRPERLFVAGQGAYLEDATGRRYLDFTSGIAVSALGHGSEIVARALGEAAGERALIHTSNLFHTAPPVELAAELVRLSFADRVFFTNSGAEATEGAVKFARLFGHEAGRAEIVTFDGSFHGRTLGALAATDRPDYQEPFRPLAGGFVQAPWNEREGLETIGPRTAAAMVEPIQGERGIRLADPRWLEALRRRCDEVGALLIFDEVQCGLGRTGTLWAHEAFGVRPDLMALAKPLAGGLPMGAVLMTERVAAAIRPGCHGTTFGGGPLVARVALAVLRTVSRPAFLARVRQRGDELRHSLQEIDSPLIEEVRGRGLFVGVKLTVPPAEVVAGALEAGLLLVPAGDGVVRFLPPLNVSAEELALGVERFARALAEVQTDGKR